MWLQAMQDHRSTLSPEQSPATRPALFPVTSYILRKGLINIVQAENSCVVCVYLFVCLLHTYQYQMHTHAKARDRVSHQTRKSPFLLGWSANQLPGSSCPYPCRWGDRHTKSRLAFYIGAGDSRSSPHTCRVSGHTHCAISPAHRLHGKDLLSL